MVWCESLLFIPSSNVSWEPLCASLFYQGGRTVNKTACPQKAYVLVQGQTQ